MAQVPVEQSADAPAREHAVRQLPQSVRVVVLVSQPSATLPLQSAQPGSQVTIAHVPDPQLPVAWGGAQATPHAPQLVSVFTRVSQPFALMPSQFEKPTEQSTRLQAPAAHEAVPFAKPQVMPQPPQLVRLRMLVSQPFVVLASQSSKPGAQVVTRQVPVEQSPVPLEGEQMEPQLPQSAFVVSGVSQPLPERPSQLPQRGEHTAMSQTPVSQVLSALLRAQVTPQPPQWVLVLSSVSQPSSGIPLQLPHPGSQVPIAHSPPVQVWVTAWGRAQVLPQLPQSVVVVVLVSQPSSGIMLQSPKPGSHIDTVQIAPSHAVPPTWVPRGQRIPGSPLSIVPSQSSSTPLHVSLAEELISVLESSQSVPRHPTPVPWRSPSSSTQHRSPTGAQTGVGMVDVKFATHSKRAGHSARSISQVGRHAEPPEVKGAQKWSGRQSLSRAHASHAPADPRPASGTGGTSDAGTSGGVDTSMRASSGPVSRLPPVPSAQPAMLASATRSTHAGTNARMDMPNLSHAPRPGLVLTLGRVHGSVSALNGEVGESARRVGTSGAW